MDISYQPDGKEQKNTGLKVAIYCRLSEEDKNKSRENEESGSIRNQKAMLLQYSMEQGWEVYNIYSDDDYAGADRGRPEFNRLLTDAAARRFDIVLCKSQSRFTRELELVEKYLHGLFPLWGIRFVSIVDNADTANRGNKKSRQINGLVNEWYLEDMSENIKSVLTNRRQNGFHIGSFALYGYQKDPDRKGHLIIDEEAAKTVRKVFTLYSQGYGKTAIARMLNDSGIPNPTEYKRLHGMRYRQPRDTNSTLWKYSAISDMLTNEIYIGNMVQGKYGSISYKTKQNKPRPKNEWYVVEGTHEPVIDRDLWDRVQRINAQRSKPFSTGEPGIFAGKTRCLYCGRAMRSSKSGGKRYLQCTSRHISKSSCPGAFISVQKLESIVLEELNRITSEYLDTNLLESGVNLCQEHDTRRGQLLADISTYKKKRSEFSEGIRRLYSDRIQGLLSENDFTDILKDFTAQKQRLEQSILATEKQLEETEKMIKSGDGKHELIKQYTNPRHLSRETVECFIDYICIGRRISGTRDVPLEIHWTF